MIPTRLDGTRLRACARDLAALLVDTVAAGSSVGFLASLDLADAETWWTGRAEAVDDGHLAVWAAYDGEHVVGTVSLAFADKPNSRHRAEVVKLMVHPRARGRGLGRTLLTAAETAAADAGITLLHLDTETGSPAERLYGSVGWTRAGVIPDFATSPDGQPRPTTIYYKRLGVPAPTR
ncbi:N-acetyltransferase family protein [Streptomyces sp. NPDC003333]